VGQSYGSNDSYVTADELKPYIDERILAEVLSDDETPVSNPFASSKFTAMRLRASGAIESACLHRGQYTVDDLENLTLASREYMVGVAAGLIWGYMRDRRGVAGDEKKMKQAQDAEDVLDALRDGARVFSVVATLNASNMESRDETQTAQATRHSFTNTARRFFGIRGGGY